jgi:hypothetical protein
VISLMNFCKTHCLMFQSLDDMHASLLDLKYRSPISSQSSCYLIGEDLLFLIWDIFICLASSPLKLTRVNPFPGLLHNSASMVLIMTYLLCWKFSVSLNNLRG